MLVPKFLMATLPLKTVVIMKIFLVKPLLQNRMGRRNVVGVGVFDGFL
jgi:hypothetical protein